MKTKDEIKDWHDFIWQGEYYCPQCAKWFDECGVMDHCPNCGHEYSGTDKCPECGEEDYENTCPDCGTDGGDGGLSVSDVWSRMIEYQWPEEYLRFNEKVTQ